MGGQSKRTGILRLILANTKELVGVLIQVNPARALDRTENSLSDFLLYHRHFSKLGGALRKAFTWVRSDDRRLQSIRLARLRAG